MLINSQVFFSVDVNGLEWMRYGRVGLHLGLFEANFMCIRDGYAE